MSNCITVKVRLSENQRRRLKSAIKNDSDLRLQINMLDVGNENGLALNLTQAQVNRLKSLGKGRAARITLSKTQLKSLDDDEDKPVDKMISLSLTPSDIEKIKKVRFNDIPEVFEFEGNSIFGSIAKIALPLVKNIATKILPTLGLAAATGAISGAAHKKTSGRGLYRAGDSLKLSKKELEDMMKIANLMEDRKMLDSGFVKRMNKDLKQQKGGFLSALLGGLAASLIPSLISGKGLYRAGSKKKS